MPTEEQLNQLQAEMAAAKVPAQHTCEQSSAEYEAKLKEHLARQKSIIEADIIAVKELRRDIDVHIQRVKNMKATRERALVITKLQEAVMWLGMDLKAINDAFPGLIANPYPNSKDPSNTKIDPTADGLKL